MMKRLTPIIMLLAFVLLGCGSVKPEETENYHYGYDVGYDAGYNDGLRDATSDSINYVRETYVIDDVYDPEEMISFLKDRGYMILDNSTIYTSRSYVYGDKGYLCSENDIKTIGYINGYYHFKSDLSKKYITSDKLDMKLSALYNAGILEGYRAVQNNSSAPSYGSQTSSEPQKYTYVGNKNTKKFHYSYCSSVSDMKESNKVFNNSRFYFTNRDYEPCKICKP